MSAPHASVIAREFRLPQNNVSGLIELLDEGASVPFIARYRKERTGEMDEVTILSVKERLEQLRTLEKRRSAVLESLGERELLTPELEKKVRAAVTLSELEDIYLPFRPKRRTRATKARELGLEPLAHGLLNDEHFDPLGAARGYVGTQEELPDLESVLQGARDIVAEIVQEDPEIRGSLRRLFESRGVLSTKAAPKKKGVNPDPEGRFKDYHAWEEPAKRAPSHRILAVLRGEQEGALTVHLLPPEGEAIRQVEEKYLRGSGERRRQLAMAGEDSYKRLIAPSLEGERKRELKARADETAATVFADNLRELLLAPPLGSKPLLALDPGFRTGCKVVLLDPQGELLRNETIYPLEPQNKKEEAKRKLLALRDELPFEAVAVGNGTGGREAVRFIDGIEELKGVPVIMVNESGASVYSASSVAREEFPDYDVTVRGAVSIGRRLMDPLAELVKIDPRSIGVGQYQHDIPPALLEQRLTDTVVSCVNGVGVELNTASPHLLRFVAGLSMKNARSIVARRGRKGPFRRREELLEIAGVGEKTYEQAAGFLRIRGGADPVDQTGVHPERYELVERIGADLGVTTAELIGAGELLDSVDPERYVDRETGLPTVRDVLAELRRPGRDPRPEFEHFGFDESVESVEDLQVGMKLPGVVTNVTNFGAFVDIGVHRDGLVHISKLAKEYVEDPRRVVKVQQQVTVTVVEVDTARNRISLSMVD